ncbi:MAG: uroporphyrinogen decarboxylase family protein [Chloroflexi bacterium]|nr:uroporphyrinogen decarboxylase family protein [Chloroflexota bacterium]
MSEAVTPLQRVLTSLSHQEPDRVPVFLLFTMHGAKVLGMSLREYYANPEHLVEAQLRLADRFGHDCLYAFWYAAGEAAAFGSEVIFYEDGPPNAGAPLTRRAADLLSRPLPDPTRVAPLKDTLEAIHRLAERNQNRRPIVGVVMAPFSLPIMLLGLERWILLLYEEPETAHRLLSYLGDFCASWANAQLAAGAHAIAFFDPMASTTMTTIDQFQTFDLAVASHTIARINGPCAYHFASGRAGPVLSLVPQTGAAAVVVGARDDLRAVKASMRGRLGVLGTLNGIEMVRWTPDEAEAAVRACLAAAGPGGGFILADQHGEIPFYVPDETLHAIMDTARRWGRYPLDWTADEPAR